MNIERIQKLGEEVITINRGGGTVENLKQYDLKKLNSLKGISQHLIDNINAYIDVMNISGSKGLSAIQTITVDEACNMRKIIQDMSHRFESSHVSIQHIHTDVAKEAYELYKSKLNGILSDEDTINDEGNKNTLTDINLDSFSENTDTLSIQGQNDIEEFILLYGSLNQLKPLSTWLDKTIDGLKKLGENPELTIKIPMISRYKNSLIEFREQTERFLLIKSNTPLKKKAIFEDQKYARTEHNKANVLFFESLEKFGFPAL